ncbi:MAG: TonB-dependent receptor [Bacteroidetes bacterium]|nr:TonB-dependent receptor [Bacteroidota bacterium]MCW5895820.1 TonB-dependent receptor [Bacteroidota bacterium]
MRTILLFLLATLCTSGAASQNTFKSYIKDAKSGEPLWGATVVLEKTASGASSDSAGYVEITNIRNGTIHIVFSLIGYKRVERPFDFPLPSNEPVIVYLSPTESELGEVVVTTTRTSRTIADEPTRIEAITTEELEEKSNMKPGDIRMLLSESTGIHIQQTSATTANAGIRIQGLDGRYTQILKDGFPLYTGFAGGLSIMQIPPLDLHQVEVIKGSASTLYGGGAIAGLINLISKSPTEEEDLNFHINGTTAGGLDINAFYSNRFDELGLTVFAAHNSNAPYDPADIDLTAIPKFERFTVNPRLFSRLGEQSMLIGGINAMFENRLGGDMHYIKNGGDSTHSYFERNKSTRISTQLSFEHSFQENGRLTLRNSVSSFNRLLEVPQYRFEGNQLSTFTEVTLFYGNGDIEWIAGLSLTTERFEESKQDAVIPKDFSQTIIGRFLQSTWDASDLLAVEGGMRLDYASEYGSFALPRISILMKLAPNLTSRIGGGLGYKLPTIFTEDAEALQFRGILPIGAQSAERSLGGNVDINYRTTILDVVSLNINQMVFYTQLDKPLVLTPSVAGAMMFTNADGHIDTRGIETNIKLTIDDLKLYLGYTLTDTKRHFSGMLSPMPLTPKHRVNTVLMYVHDEWRLGAEAYYFDTQLLPDGTKGQSYWICGLMAEKTWEKFSLYINFENFLDTRQTRFGSIYTGTITNPIFNDLFAPVDGFVMNGGIKLRL